MHIVANLESLRKVIVGKALADTLAVVRPVPLTDATRARAEAVVAATEGLRPFVRHRPQKVDRAADVIVTSCDRTLDDKERSFRDDVVPLGAAQHEEFVRVRRLRTRLFPQGTEFTRLSMDLQWGEFVALRARAQEPQVAADIDALGMRAQIDHLFAHIDLYGCMLGQDADHARAGEEKASAAWTAAFQLFVAQVLLDCEKDAALSQELLGPYEAQLAQQRAALRAKKARTRAGSEVEQPAPPPTQASASPTAG